MTIQSVSEFLPIAIAGVAYAVVSILMALPSRNKRSQSR